MNERSHIAVVGAGSVGCFYGGLLAKAGHEVTLIGRKHHVDAINAHGLRVELAESDEQIAVKASTQMADIAGADLVLVCVKSPDSQATALEMKPFLKANAVILSLQNGVDNCQRLQAVLTQACFATVVYVATGMQGPGHVKHFGRNELILGDVQNPNHPSPTLNEIARLFNQAGIQTEVSKTVGLSLWSKFLVNCTYNGISAIGQMSYGNMVKIPEILTLITEITKEVLQVAHHEGVSIALEDAIQMNERIFITMNGQKSSTAQDLARKRPTEIEYLNGYIVRKGREYGIATPFNETIYTLVKILESTQTTA